MPVLARSLAAAALVAALPLGASAAADGLEQHVVNAYAKVRSYQVVVLGSVRSKGVFNAPDRYQMRTVFGGKPIETVIVGHEYWTQSGGKWQKSGTASNSLDVDITGMLRNAKANPSHTFVPMAPVSEDGKQVGTFSYTFASGMPEVCNYDLKTFLATRCKAQQITLLYSKYDDPSNVVAKVK